MKNKIELYIKSWKDKCYTRGIPDELPLEIEQKTNQPSYRKIALAILNNDHSLKSLGFTPKQSQYYYDLKRMELLEKGKIKVVQLKIF